MSIATSAPSHEPLTSGTDRRERVCLNCGAPLVGPFCAECGQRDVPPHPSVRELAGEAFGELTGWDGKFVETFKLLLTKPGAITRQFIEGRRIRFISPVRLYLTMSVIFFLIAPAAPDLSGAGVTNAGIVQVRITDDNQQAAKPTGPAIASRAAKSGIKTGAVDATLRDSALKQLVRAPWWVKPILQRAIVDPQGLKHNIFENMPRVLFALLPIFALILEVFYRRQRYPAHLYFAIHFHTVVFMLLAVSELARFTHVPAIATSAAVVMQLAIPVYGVIALRGMYGGTIAVTLAKGFGVAAMYCVVSAVAIYGLTYYASVAR